MGGKLAKYCCANTITILHLYHKLYGPLVMYTPYAVYYCHGAGKITIKHQYVLLCV